MNAKPKMRVREATVLELAEGWAVIWPGAKRITRCRTAADALRAIKRSGRRFAKRDVSTIHVITWSTSTHLGRQIARAVREAR